MKTIKKSYVKKHVYKKDYSDLKKLFAELDKKDAEKLAQ